LLHEPGRFLRRLGFVCEGMRSGAESARNIWYNSGVKIGECETVRLLGKGGMSEVYEAESARLGSRHAVKVYAYPKEDDEVRRRFVAEGQMLAKLNHPRVVRVTDFGTTEAGRPYFVMDLVLSPEGHPQTLADIPDGSVDEETIGRWYDDIREGLAYIHAKGVVHRDLKLQNVMIGPDGHAVLTDFGISRVCGPDDGGEAVVDPVQTIIRVRDGKSPVMGSLGYMAPELELGLPATSKSDWYALGVLVYRLLTGTWCDARTDVVTTLSTFDPVWQRIVPKLLHANPEGRACLSYAEERMKDMSAAEAAAEDRYLAEKRRGHVARHVARYVGGVSLLLVVVAGWCVHELRSRGEAWRLRMQMVGSYVIVPSFDELFRIPTEAKNDEVTDDDGNTVMPSRAQFEAARVDALVLTQPTFSALASGNITAGRAIDDFERIAVQLTEDADTSPFDNLNFGGNSYMQFGENAPLRMLLERAVEKLRSLAET